MQTDEQLVSQLKKKNTEAIDELYKRYSQKLYVFFKNIMRNRNPEDLVHDVFIKVIENAPKFNPKKASFNTWMFRIARNLCIDDVRREKKLSVVSLDKESRSIDAGEGSTGAFVESIEDTSRTVEDSLYITTIFRTINECIGKLEKEQEKQAVLLYYISGKVYREIGDITGKSISMVKKRINSAQEKMRRCLESRGIKSFQKNE
ncbi:RNA polymerase sigma factor [candidate division KSB1 bacterium]